MKLILNLIGIDITAMGGKKNGAFVGLIVLFFVCAVYSIVLPPFLAMYIPIFSVLAVSDITGRELRQEYEKTFCVVPADRKSIVLARFVMMGAAVTALSIILYIVMRIIMLFSTEIFNELLELFNMNTSAVAFINSIFAAFFAVGMGLMSASLRKYFRYGAVNRKNSLLLTVLKILLGYIIVAIVIALLAAASNVPFLMTLFGVLYGMLSALSSPAEGLLLSLLLIVIGYGTAIYQTVCAVIEYNEREL